MSTTTVGTRPTLGELGAQLRDVKDAQRANAALPTPSHYAAVADKLAHYAERAEQRAVLLERQRDLWSEVAAATYDSGLVADDALLLLLREAAIRLGGHVSPEALEARRYADGAAKHLAAIAAERPTERTS